MAGKRQCANCGEPLAASTAGAVCLKCKMREVRGLLAASVSLPEQPIAGPDDVPDTSAATPELPGKYTGLREVAHGGMGRILLAHDEHLGRDIVIKELLGSVERETVTGSPDWPLKESTPLVHRFVREARITGQLEHPSIVPVHEFGVRENGDLYYTMKYVRGRSMADAIREAPSLKERMALLPHVLDTCQAVAYAHSRGVIHRDIKPANIMVGEFGETVLLDWGLARIKEAPEDTSDNGATESPPLDPGVNGEETAVGHILGTPAYMAPEQIVGRMARADERTDVYALGALLYTMLTGKAPYAGEDREVVLQKIVDTPPLPILECVPLVVPELAAICEKAMARKSGQRYTSAKALANELQHFMEGGLVSAYDYHLSEHLRRFVSRHRWALATAGAAAVLLLAVAVVAYLRIDNERNRAVLARDEATQARDAAIEAGKLATRAREETEQQLYSTSIANAQGAVEARRYDDAANTILGAPVAYWGWEWGLLAALSDPDVLVLTDPGNELLFPAFSPDGCFLAASSKKGEVLLWNASNGELLRRLKGQDTSRSRVCFSPDSRLLAAPSENGWLRVWEVESGRRLLNIRAHNGGRMVADFDPAGATIATASMDGSCKMWDLNTGEERLTVTVASGISSVAFSPDGQRLATAGKENFARVWDTTTGRELMRLVGHKGILHSVQFSANGRQIATSGSDSTLRVWDANTGEQVQTLQSPKSGVGNLNVSPDSQHIYATVGDFSVAGWSLTDGKLEQVLEGCAFNTSNLTSFGMDFVNQRVATHRDGQIVARSLLPLHDELLLSGHTDTVNTAAFSPDSHLLATGSGNWNVSIDNRAIIWDVTTGRRLIVLEGHRGPVNALVFLSDGERILTGSADGTAALWNVRTGKRLQHFDVHGTVRALALEPDESVFMTAGWDDGGRVRLWELETGHQVTVLEAPSTNNTLESLDYDPKAQLLAVGSRADGVIVWDAKTYDSVARLTTPGEWVTAMAFSPDGRTLATGGSSGGIGSHGTTDITLWDTSTWTITTTLRGHTARVMSLVFHPDGHRLVSGSADGTVRLWDLAHGKEVLTLRSHTGGVTSVAFSPDGRALATGSYDKTAMLWRAFPWQLEEMAGDPDMKLRARIQLEREAREREIAAREPLVDAWQRETEQRKSCYAQLLALDDAKLAWTRDKVGVSLDAIPTKRDLLPYLSKSDESSTCPFGGTYQLGTVEELPSCSEHSAPEENPSLTARFDELLDFDDVVFKVALSRLRNSPYESRTLVELLERLTDENDSVYQAILARLYESPNADAGDIAALADMYSEKREFKKAVEAYSRAIELEPDNAGAFYRRGNFYWWHTSQYRKSVADLTRAIELNPAHPQSWYRRARSYQYLGEFEKAVADYSEVIAMEAMDFWPWYRRGEVYVAMEKWNNAVKDLSNAIQMNPAEIDEYLLRAIAYSKLNQFEKALYDLNRFKERVETQNDSTNWYRLALAQLAYDGLDAYRTTCSSMLERCGQSQESEDARWTAWTCTLAPDAVADTEAVLRLARLAYDADAEQNIVTLGAALYRAGQFEEATTYLGDERVDRATFSSPAYGWFWLSMAQHRLGHNEAARQAFDRAVAQAKKELEENAAWNRRATLDLLRKESEALLNGTEAVGPVSEPTKGQ